MVFIASAQASTPTKTLIESINTTISNGYGLAGNIIITNNEYTPQDIIHNNFSDIFMQQHDRLIWTGQETIQIKNPSHINETIIVPGNSFVFLGFGTYYAQSISNSSKTFNIQLSKGTPLKVNLSATDEFIKYTFVPSKFEIPLSTQEQVIKVYTNASTDLTAGSYPTRIKISTNIGNQEIEKQIIVKESRSWKLINNSIPLRIEVESGSFQQVGNIKILNTGNMEYKITTKIVGNASEFISTQDELTAYKKTSLAFNFHVQIPNKQQDGRYYADIFLVNSDFSRRYNLTIIVKDTTFPEIKSINFTDRFVHHDNTVRVLTSDNLDTVSANITYNGLTYVMNKDEQLFTHQTRFTNLTKYIFKVCISDASKNHVCQEINKTFEKLLILNTTTIVNLPSKNVDIFASTRLFTLKENPPDPIILRLIDFNVEGMNHSKKLEDYGINLRIIGGSGKLLPLNKINQTVQIVSAGDINIEIRASKPLKYDGVIQIEAPEYITGYTNTTTFTGKIITYTIPSDFTQEWYGREDGLSCHSVDNGDAESSFVRCTIIYPITTGIDDFSVPITLEQKQSQQNNFNERTLSWEKKQKTMAIGIGVLLGLLIISFVLLYYGTKIKPFFRARPAINK